MHTIETSLHTNALRASITLVKLNSDLGPTTSTQALRETLEREAEKGTTNVLLDLRKAHIDGSQAYQVSCGMAAIEEAGGHFAILANPTGQAGRGMSEGMVKSLLSPLKIFVFTDQRRAFAACPPSAPSSSANATDQSLKANP